MQEFSSYEKMPNNFKKLNLKEEDFKELDKLSWVVTEKIHGANFSFIYEGRTLKFGKRKEYLSWKDDFFGFQTIVKKYEENILEVFEELSSKIKGAKYIIYGELFGGQYPHPDVPAIDELNAIQTGVYYSPKIEFCAFDIAIESEEEKYYLDFEKAIGYFEKHGLFYAKPLFVGKLNEAIDFNIRINSTIPRQLHLPEIEANLIEGIVLKPFNHLESKLSIRPILKLKNPEFEEEKKFHEAEKWSYLPEFSSNTEDLGFLLEELRNYNTKNRLNSAISKVGALDINNEKRLLEIKKEVVEDILNDFNENNDTILSELNENQMNWIKKRLEFEVKELIGLKGKNE